MLRPQRIGWEYFTCCYGFAFQWRHRQLASFRELSELNDSDRIQIE